MWRQLQIKCADCGKIYIGETARPLDVRLKEHSNTTRSTLSAVGKHLRDTGHKLEESKAAVIAREKKQLQKENS